MTEWPIEKNVLRKQPRVELPGEARGMKAIGALCISLCALVVATVAAAAWKAVR